MYVYQSDTGYKGAGTFLSDEGKKADTTDKKAGLGTANDGTSKNFAKEGSVLFEVLKEFPKGKEDLAFGSPFVFTQEGKKVTKMGGVDALREWTTKTFPDNADIQKQNIDPVSFGGFINVFNNETPGFTMPSPLPEKKK